MSGIDVRDLVNEKLAYGEFPVEPRSDFRLYIAPEVRRGIDEHAKADVTVEICGVLVGNWGTDENGPYAAVTDYIRCANATSKFAEVTFTHESWAQINKEMDSRFADARIIGWYHSHPDFGIFLSERDAFIQEHFFSGPGQVAYVIDPVRDLEGVFAWRNGKPTPMPHYWIGDRVRTVEATERSAGGTAAKPQAAGVGNANGPERKTWDSSLLGIATMVLGGLCMLLLGNLYGGWRARAEEDAMRREAVARLSDIELIRMGHEAELESVRQRLNAISESLRKMPPIAEKASKEQLKEAEVRQQAIQQHLKLSEESLNRAQVLSNSEWDRYSRVIELKMTELQRMIEEAAAAVKKRESAQKTSQVKAPTKDNSPKPPQAETSVPTDAKQPPPPPSTQPQPPKTK
jgi:proteasome lid subunit RPN8/RPN11